MYSIHAGSHDGTLDALRIRTGHDTAADALAALRRHMRGQGHGALVTVHCDDGVYVYLGQADADRDPDGASAFAVIDAASEDR